jgi:hypothetical protein
LAAAAAGYIYVFFAVQLFILKIMNASGFQGVQERLNQSAILK